MNKKLFIIWMSTFQLHPKDSLLYAGFILKDVRMHVLTSVFLCTWFLLETETSSKDIVSYKNHRRAFRTKGTKKHESNSKRPKILKTIV